MRSTVVKENRVGEGYQDSRGKGAQRNPRGGGDIRANWKEMRGPSGYLGKEPSSRGNVMCKGPEAGLSLHVFEKHGGGQHDWSKVSKGERVGGEGDRGKGGADSVGPCRLQ